MKNILLTLCLLFYLASFGQTVEKSTGILYFSNKASLDAYGAPPASYGAEFCGAGTPRLLYRWDGSAWVEVDSGGDVSNSSGSVDNQIARYDGATGKIIQNSLIEIDDNAELSKVDAIQFNLAASVAHAEGKMHWDADSGTVEIGMPGGNVRVQVGQETVIRVTNSTGGTLTNGQAVYINGSLGNKPTIALANAGGLGTASVTGVLTEDIANNNNGYVTTFGLVRDLNTSAFSAGAVLWLSTTDGVLTDTRPAPPNTATIVGVVVVSHATTGIILVSIARVPRIVGLSDVNIASPNDGDIISYDNASSTWVSGQPTGGSLWTQSGSDIYYNSGNVGVNNPSPTSTLDVIGQVEIFDNTCFINSTNSFSGHTGLYFTVIGNNCSLGGSSSNWTAFGDENANFATSITSSFFNGNRNFQYPINASYSFAAGEDNFRGLTGVAGTVDFNFGAGLRNFYKHTSGEFNFAAGFENFYEDSLSVGSFGSGFQNFYNAHVVQYSLANGYKNFNSATLAKYNFGNGYENFLNISDGDNNFGNGFRNFYNVTGTASNNFAAGFQNFFTSTSSLGNIGIGQEVGYHISSGNYNIMLGNRAGYNVSAITSNSIVIGNGTGKGATSLSNSVVLGAEAMDANTNSLVVSIGFKDQPDASNQISLGSSTNYTTAKFRNYRFDIDQSLTGLDDYHLTYNESSDYFEATTPAMGNHIFDYDQILGASEDGYVETYDNGTGLVSLQPTPSRSCAEMYITSASPQVLAITTGVYSKIIGHSTDIAFLQGFTYATGTFTKTASGTQEYYVTASVSGSFGTGNTVIEANVFVNGVIVDKIAYSRKIGTGGDVDSAPLSGLLSLTLNDTVDVRLKADNTDDWTTENLNFSVIQAN